jgi:hypothetical protein
MENTPEVRKIEIEEDTLKYLSTIRKWSMFLAILGFIGIGLLVLIGLVAGVFLSVFKSQNSPFGISESLVFLVIIVIVVLYFFPVLYLFRFSKHTANAVRLLDKLEMHKAIKNLRSYYVFTGVFVIVVLALYLVLFIVTGASVAFLKT